MKLALLVILVTVHYAYNILYYDRCRTPVVPVCETEEIECENVEEEEAGASLWRVTLVCWSECTTMFPMFLSLCSLMNN